MEAHLKDLLKSSPQIAWQPNPEAGGSDGLNGAKMATGRFNGTLKADGGFLGKAPILLGQIWETLLKTFQPKRVQDPEEETHK